MPKFCDTVLLHVNRYNDETKQIKRRIYESVLDSGRAPTVAEICKDLSLPQETVRKSLHDLDGGIIIAL
jgi:DNA-directed RNA polymerase specialized sigma subunit